MRDPKALVQRAANPARVDFPELPLGLDNFAGPLFLAGLRDDEHHVVAALPPRRHLLQEFAARVFLPLEPLLGDERVIRITPVVD